MNIKKGDKVKVMTGKDAGKTSTVLRAFPKKELVLLEGLNIKKRHQRARSSKEPGQIVERPHPVHVSNVQKIKS